MDQILGVRSRWHSWFQTWVREGVFEAIMRDSGGLVEERKDYRLYECFADGTFSKARGGGDDIGYTKAGRGVKKWCLWMRENCPWR